MDGERFRRLQTVWEDATARRRADTDANAALVQGALSEWPRDEVADAVRWIQARLAAGEDPGPFAVEEGCLEEVIDVDGDPRADLVDTVWLAHSTYTAEQIARLARRAPQIVSLHLEEVLAKDELAGLFPGTEPWSRLRTLVCDACEFDSALMPGLARTALPALRSARFYQHADFYKLEGARWLATLEHLAIDHHAGALAWLGEVELTNLVELEIANVHFYESYADEVSDVFGVGQSRRPRLARIVFTHVPDDCVLPMIAGLEVLRR